MLTAFVLCSVCSCCNEEKIQKSVPHLCMMIILDLFLNYFFPATFNIFPSMFGPDVHWRVQKPNANHQISQKVIFFIISFKKYKDLRFFYKYSTLSISWPRHFPTNFVIISFIFHLDIPYNIKFSHFNLRIG